MCVCNIYIHYTYIGYIQYIMMLMNRRRKNTKEEKKKNYIDLFVRWCTVAYGPFTACAHIEWGRPRRTAHFFRCFCSSTLELEKNVTNTLGFENENETGIHLSFDKANIIIFINNIKLILRNFHSGIHYYPYIMMNG